MPKGTQRKVFQFTNPAAFNHFTSTHKGTLQEIRKQGTEVQVRAYRIVLLGEPGPDFDRTIGNLTKLKREAEEQAKSNHDRSQMEKRTKGRNDTTRSNPVVKNTAPKVQVQPKTRGQKDYMDKLQYADVVFGLGPAGTGKAQPLSSKVLTPTGWVPMGETSVGMLVQVPDGGTAEITGVFPQGKKDVYRVWFTDNTFADCCDDHLWLTKTCLDRDARRAGSVRPLKEIRQTLRYGTIDKHNHSIPITAPLHFPEAVLAIEPYTMGALLGDGGFRGGFPVFSSVDAEMLETVEAEVSSLEISLKYASGCDYRLVGERSGGVVPNALKKALVAYGVWGLKSEGKFIPKAYLFGSLEQRTALLQGLMDSDGTVDKNGACVTFTTTSPQLSADFQHLVQSLGGTARTVSRITHYTHKGEFRDGLLSYRSTVVLPNSIPPFRLRRKASLVVARTKYFPRRYIDKVEHLGQEECQCIQIGHPEHLYITDHFVVTHNTFLAVAAAMRAMENGDVERIVITRPAVEAGEKLGFLPGSFSDKVDPYLQPIYDSLAILSSRPQVEAMKRDGRIEIAPLAFMRGRTLAHAFVILDEAQNCTWKQIVMLLTRMGEGSKIVVTGDASQTDLYRNQSGLSHIVKALENVQGIAMHNFGHEDVVRHPMVAKIVAALETCRDPDED